MSNPTKLKKTSKRIGTPEQPYSIENGVMMWLPFYENATGSRHADIIAELDDGYLTVFDKTFYSPSVTFIPKNMVQR